MSHGRTILLCCLLTTVALPALAADSGSPAPMRPPTPAERLLVRKHEDLVAMDAIGRALEAAMQQPLQPVDVERYTIDIGITLATERVDGSVRLQARALENGVSSLTVDLYDEMGVTSILSAGALPLAFSRGADQLQITLDHSYMTGELIDITIGYGGTPPYVGWGAFTFQTHAGEPIVSSLSEPDGAPTWWPCVDHPADKAIVDMDLTVPSTLIAVSNGVLAGEIDHPDDTTTYQWRSSYPISTYLVSVAISNYVTWTDSYEPVTGGPAMPVQHWVYPEHLTAAQQDLSVTVPMLTFFSTVFGEYPFVNEKYGHAIFPWGGAMEHQTATSYGAGLIWGDNHYDWIVAHEMAHQWWGDSISPAEWPEIWLNEGFATYSEALWQESLSGAPGLHSWMASVDTRPFCGTLYDPGSCGLFGHTVYDKGAWVLHMLRHIVGDVAFFQGLRDYAAAFAYGNATTSDFEATMEAASGMLLFPFFQRWVYVTGEPDYHWGWSSAPSGSGWITYVRIEQVQSSPVFTTPIDVAVTTSGGTSTFIVEPLSVAEDFALPPLPQEPIDVALDPDDWILKSDTLIALADGDGDGVHDTADNCPLAENPGQEDLDLDGVGDACDPDIDGDGRDNVDDCAPADPFAQDPPSEVSGVAAAGAAIITLTWNPAPEAGPGFTYEALRGSLSDMRSGSGFDNAACFATGLTLPTVDDDASTAAGDGLYYVIRGRNTCGAGTIGTASSGPRPTPTCP